MPFGGKCIQCCTFSMWLSYACCALTTNTVCFQAWPPGIECQICHMTFSDQSAISAHYDTEHGQPTRRRRSEHGTGNCECDVCGKRYSAKSKLKFHQANAHGIGNVPIFQCDLCSRKFNVKGSLKRHLSAIHHRGDVTEFK